MGVSVISLPTTIVLTAHKSEIFKPVNNVVETASSKAKERFGELDQNLNKEYKNFGKEVVDNATTTPKQVSAQLQSIGTGAQSITKLANDHKENVNYYSFKLGHLIKALLKQIPNIAKESVIEAAGWGKDKHLLSAQKIYNIASNSKFNEFIMGMTTVAQKHGALLSNLSNEDNSGIIQIFKELQNDENEIERFLSKVKENSDKVAQSSEDYQCATKLMMHVLIGKEEMEKMNSTIENLTNLLDKVKSILETNVFQNLSEGGERITVESLKNKLTEIKNKSDGIQNPCPKS